MTRACALTFALASAVQRPRTALRCADSVTYVIGSRHSSELQAKESPRQPRTKLVTSDCSYTSRVPFHVSSLLTFTRVNFLEEEHLMTSIPEFSGDWVFRIHGYLQAAQRHEGSDSNIVPYSMLSKTTYMVALRYPSCSFEGIQCS
jgi:hypothetical protein